MAGSDPDQRWRRRKRGGVSRKQAEAGRERPADGSGSGSHLAHAPPLFPYLPCDGQKQPSPFSASSSVIRALAAAA